MVMFDAARKLVGEPKLSYQEIRITSTSPTVHPLIMSAKDAEDIRAEWKEMTKRVKENPAEAPILVASQDLQWISLEPKFDLVERKSVW